MVEISEPLATPPGPATGIVLGETHIDWDACDITVNGVHCTSLRQVNREMWHHLAEIQDRKPQTLRQRIAAWLRRRNHA